MDIQVIRNSLNSCYDRLINAKSDLFKVSEIALLAESDLKKSKVIAINSGGIDGKNETIREGQLRDMLKDKYDYLELKQKDQREFSNMVQIYQLDLNRWRDMLHIWEMNKDRLIDDDETQPLFTTSEDEEDPF
jgi:hypothetical protein